MWGAQIVKMPRDISNSKDIRRLLFTTGYWPHPKCWLLKLRIPLKCRFSTWPSNVFKCEPQTLMIGSNVPTRQITLFQSSFFFGRVAMSQIQIMHTKWKIFAILWTKRKFDYKVCLFSSVIKWKWHTFFWFPTLTPKSS